MKSLQTFIYIDPNFSGKEGDGLSIDTPCKSIQKAFEIANQLKRPLTKSGKTSKRKWGVFLVTKNKGEII